MRFLGKGVKTEHKKMVKQEAYYELVQQHKQAVFPNGLQNPSRIAEGQEGSQSRLGRGNQENDTRNVKGQPGVHSHSNEYGH